MITTNMNGKKYYIGLACSFHDPAIAILDTTGKVLFAEATERSMQSKRARGSVCDEIHNITNLVSKYCPDGEEFIISYSWSKSYLNRLLFQSFFGITKIKKIFLEFALKNIAPKILSSYDLVGLEYFQLSSITQAGVSCNKVLKSTFPTCTIKNIYYRHHLTHATYACYTSPFENALCIVMDGFGEQGSFSIYDYRNNKINPVFYQGTMASLGFYYALITRICGFDSYKGEEWKVMGLAPYGKSDDYFYAVFKSMIRVKGHTFKFTPYRHWLNLLKEISPKVNNLSFSEKANIAFTGQLVFSEVMEELLNNIYKFTNHQNLIYTGGCALNSSFNGQILNKTKYNELYVPPAPADDGNALGAALLSYYQDNSRTVSNHKNHSAYLGTALSNDSMANFLKHSGIRQIRFLPENICDVTASLLAEGKLVGWVQGRAEFGPRALGNRSILADPRLKEMKAKINNCIKFREEFRPFAPAILHEHGPEYFDNYTESPFMESTFVFKKEVIEKVPAVVHLDNTGRLQSVTKELNDKFYNLIQSFYKLTNIPLVLNTSFNIMNKPIIHTIEDAISVFYTSGLEILVIDDYLIEK